MQLRGCAIPTISIDFLGIWMAFWKLMASLEAENRSGLAFRVCLKMNTNLHRRLKGVKSSSDMIEKPGGAEMLCGCVSLWECVFVSVMIPWPFNWSPLESNICMQKTKPLVSSFFFFWREITGYYSSSGLRGILCFNLIALHTGTHFFSFFLLLVFFICRSLLFLED